MDPLFVISFIIIGLTAIIYGIAQLSHAAAWIAFGWCCLLAGAWPFIRARWFGA